MAPRPKERTIRVGLLVAASLLVLMIFVFFIGSEQKIFSRKNEYKVRLDNVTGLAEGNPVKISGVTVGVIKDITLPFDPKMRDVDIQLMVDRKYADRIRTDSRARMKKLGLLAGDSYIDISPGSPKFDALEPGAMIPAARQTNVDQLISSGEDLVDNFVQISYSLKNVLGRVDRGEGLIGEFTGLLHQLNDTVAKLNRGEGTAGKLVNDPSVYESVNDILIGINESKLLRWLIRNRQQSGIQKRYETESSKPAPATPPPPATKPATKSEAPAPDVPPVATNLTTTATSTSPPMP